MVFVAITNYVLPYTPHLLEWTQSNGLRDMGVLEGGPTTGIQNWQYVAGLSDLGNVLVGMLEADQAIRVHRDTDVMASLMTGNAKAFRMLIRMALLNDL